MIAQMYYVDTLLGSRTGQVATLEQSVNWEGGSSRATDQSQQHSEQDGDHHHRWSRAFAQAIALSSQEPQTGYFHERSQGRLDTWINPACKSTGFYAARSDKTRRVGSLHPRPDSLWNGSSSESLSSRSHRFGRMVLHIEPCGRRIRSSIWVALALPGAVTSTPLQPLAAGHSLLIDYSTIGQSVLVTQHIQPVVLYSSLSNTAHCL